HQTHEERGSPSTEVDGQNWHLRANFFAVQRQSVRDWETTYLFRSGCAPSALLKISEGNPARLLLNRTFGHHPSRWRQHQCDAGQRNRLRDLTCDQKIQPQGKDDLHQTYHRDAGWLAVGKSLGHTELAERRSYTDPEQQANGFAVP